MKIVLVNYRYFISGGPERYYFNIKRILEQEGHTVIPFSIKSPKNYETEYDRYFLESVDDEEYFANTKRNAGTVLKSFTRMFWSREATRKFRRLLLDTRPDMVYIMQYHNKRSPSIIYTAHKLGIPVVHRISDFQYMCPNALFYNDRTGVCEDCLEGRRMSCIRNRCVHGSTMLSAIKAAAKALHDTMGVTRRIDAFVVPSEFTLGKLRRYGIPAEKLRHIPTFFNQDGDLPKPIYEPFFLYVGRIEKQKGLATLLKAFEGTGMNLKIIGFSNDGYENTLKASLDGKRHNIEFLGRMTFDEISPYLNTCIATIVPSEWYDNFPNAILESVAYSKPVIATDFGSLKELVENNITGYTFPYADSDALRERAQYLLDNPAEAQRMGTEARRRIESEYSPRKHYEVLMQVLQPLTNQRSS